MHFRPSPRYAGQSARRPRVRVGQPDRPAVLALSSSGLSKNRILCPNLRKRGQKSPFSDDRLARTILEYLRWPQGRECPRCRVKQRTVPLGPKAARVYRCQSCGYRFSVTSGTLLDYSRVPLHKWWIAAGMIVEDHKCAATNFSGV